MDSILNTSSTGFLTRISEAYQIKDLQLLNVESSCCSRNNGSHDYQKLINSKDHKAAQLQNLVFKVVYPQNFVDMFHQDFNTNCIQDGFKRNSEDTQSHISPSKDLYKVENSLYEEPISEVIRRINDVVPKKKEKIKKANSSQIFPKHPNVFRIDDGLYFLETEEGFAHSHETISQQVKEKCPIKMDGRQQSERKMENLFKKKLIGKLSQNGNVNPKVSMQIKKNIKKKKRTNINKKKWGYIKNDFIYYGSNKHNVGEFSSKETFMIKIPLAHLKE